jgi:hypothetical protein
LFKKGVIVVDVGDEDEQKELSFDLDHAGSYIQDSCGLCALIIPVE